MKGGWRDAAACRGEDPDLFFSEVPADAAEAKAICAGCPVRPDCLDFAFTRPANYGTWGGLTEDERTAERRRQIRRAAAARRAAA